MEKPLGDIPSSNHKHPALASATDFDTDPEGRLYVADRGAEAVKIFDAKGMLVASDSKFGRPFPSAPCQMGSLPLLT